MGCVSSASQEDCHDLLAQMFSGIIHNCEQVWRTSQPYPRAGWRPRKLDNIRVKVNITLNVLEMTLLGN